jgi:LysR family transcriptional regulator (chromosome initiation inhibitor)
LPPSWKRAAFERAAQRLNVTQSAVSQRLRALEAQVGSVLIVRSRPLKATAAGQLLLKHTKQLRLLRADLERDLQELAPSATGGLARGRAHLDRHQCRQHCHLGHGRAARPGAPAPAAGNHHRRPGFHPGMAALGPGAGLRHHAQAGAARLQDGAAGRHALCGGGLGRLCAAAPAPGADAAQLSRCVVFVVQPQGRHGRRIRGAAFGLKRVALNHLFVPSTEGQMRAVRRAGAWA